MPSTSRRGASGGRAGWASRPTPPPSRGGRRVDVPPASRRIDLAAVRALAPPLLAVLLAFGVTGILIVAAGKNPLLAYWSLAHGAFGSWDRIAVGLNRATPYALTGVGIALCFRARVINIGGEGQLALGGLAATWGALPMVPAPRPIATLCALGGGVLARSEEHTSELQSLAYLVCRLLLEKKKKQNLNMRTVSP